MKTKQFNMRVNKEMLRMLDVIIDNSLKKYGLKGLKNRTEVIEYLIKKEFKELEK